MVIISASDFDNLKLSFNVMKYGGPDGPKNFIVWKESKNNIRKKFPCEVMTEKSAQSTALPAI